MDRRSFLKTIPAVIIGAVWAKAAKPAEKIKIPLRGEVIDGIWYDEEPKNPAFEEIQIRFVPSKVATANLRIYAYNQNGQMQEVKSIITKMDGKEIYRLKYPFSTNRPYLALSWETKKQGEKNSVG